MITEKLITIAENVPKVYESGKKDEYDTFWKAFTKDGTRTIYMNAFNNGWNDETFNPPPDLFKPTNLYNAFNKSDMTIIDIDTSLCINLGFVFYYCNAVEIGVVDCRKATSLERAFCACPNLTTVRKVILRAENTYNLTFDWAYNITNLMVEGTIGQNGFDVSMHKKLTHDSLMSIINCLQDKTSDTSATNWVCTLGTTNLNKLTNEERAVATEKGWTLA